MNPGQSERIRLQLSAQAEKYARKDAPPNIRRMAARGALPLEPLELTTVLFALAHDSEPQIKDTARKSLEDLPDSVLLASVEGRLHPAILSYLARAHSQDEGLCQKIALNPQTSDETIAYLASLPLVPVVDVISHNQERMLRHDGIVESLGRNPLTGRATIERILEFLGLPSESASAQSPSQPDLSEEAAEQAVLALLGQDSAGLASLLASEQTVEDEVAQGNLFAAIQNMSVMQKIKLARFGGKEARSLLIKDRNKVVATSVVASPKITETEIVSIAQSRAISEEILRLISANKDWTRNYSVKLALTRNPKTPQPQAVKFLNYLQDRDLKALMKSKDVPSAISTHARRILTKKGKF
ncbi:MAG: hypothetical protein CBC48_14920 [bacterium TMED88]|nr:hypothetical protein [Deltaproteobacteria bacterium]OUV26820.1 MAG: hypothetical protein CBC48_14920 [bacterium TMED88]